MNDPKKNIQKSVRKPRAARRVNIEESDAPVLPDLSAYEKAKQEEDSRSSLTTDSSPLKEGSDIIRKPEPSKEGEKKKKEEDSEIFKTSIKERQKKNKKAEKKASAKGMGATSGILRAVIYIVSVLVVSGFLSWGIISVANDVFAFVKSDEEIIVSVTEGQDIESVAKLLHDKGIIRFPGIFKMYAELRHKSEGIEGGEYTISPSTTYDNILAIIRNTINSREQISVTVPEGTTTNDLINIFLEQNIKYSYTSEGGEKIDGTLTRDGFVNVIQNYDFDFDFVRNIPQNEGRVFRLEGYFYPDTYNFYSSYPDCTEEEAIVKIIYKFLQNFDNKFTQNYKDRATELGYSVDEVITLASIIQHEAYYVTDYNLVSSVFHNRLNNYTSTGGKLESDATVEYALPERVADLTEAELSIDSPYNTRIYPGLPPSAICNPGIDAIGAALYPDQTDYYYFYSLDDGTILYATTYNGHLANIATAGG